MFLYFKGGKIDKLIKIEEKEEEKIENEDTEEKKETKEENIKDIEIVEEEEKTEVVNNDYLEIQMKIILSNKDTLIMWDEYKRYVDELVFKGLQDATICR